MKKLQLVLISILMLSLCIAAYGQQTAREALREDPTRAGNLLHHYEIPAVIANTPAPAGYKPFYVSHYGRHGSRYQVSTSTYDRLIPYLDALEAAGLLTDEGKSIADDIREIGKEHEGMAGVLTQRGGAEHQGIAQRLYDRVPEVFHQKDRWNVMAASTTVPRVLQSMANFCSTIKGNAPELYFNFYTGDRFGDYLCDFRGDPDRERATAQRQKISQVEQEMLHPERVFKAFFKDPAAAEKVISTPVADPESKADAPRMLPTYTPARFMTAMMTAGAIANCMDDHNPDIYHYFTEDEIYAFWAIDNMGTYNGFTTNLGNGGAPEYTGRLILKDMVEKADEAIAGNNRAADFRFGHDTGIGPLLGLLAVEGYDKPVDPIDATDNWNCFQMLPMGSNFQMIFYSNAKNDVIVKLIRNDIETTIPAVPTIDGLFYKWSDLRAYFVEKLKGMETRRK